MLKTKEQLLYYFNGQNIKLSTYDDRFCNNLQHLIAKNNRVTSNQKELFEKLISKYKKQIIQSGLDVEICKQLPWTTNIVPSEERYTGAQVSMLHNGEQIIVKVPFNKKFITSLRDSNRYHSLEWERNEKHYIGLLTTTSIKFLVDELPKHFPSVIFDDKLQDIINLANSYRAEIFNPTLVKVNDYYVIAAINNELYEHIKHIELNDDAKTLFLLSQYGVNVHDSIVKNDKKKLFASTMIANIDITELDDALSWLREFDVDMVYFGGRFSSSSAAMPKLARLINGDKYVKKMNKIVKNMEKQLNKLNIAYKDNSKFFKDKNIDKQPVVIQFMQGVYTDNYEPGKRVSKFIVVLDSSPVDFGVINEAS